MDPISVPAPPGSAYNPNRRVSDLLLSQLQHFQHIEQKHGPLGIDPAIARDVHTEAGAARYIAAMTRALHGQTAAGPAKLAVVQAPQPAKESRTSFSLDIAAAGETSETDTNTAPIKSAKSTAKKAVSQKANAKKIAPKIPGRR